MGDNLESESTDDRRCSHDWKMEPPWRLVSRGRCHKCKEAKTFLNNPGDEKSTPRNRPRRGIGRRRSRDSGDVTGEANEAS